MCYFLVPLSNIVYLFTHVYFLIEGSIISPKMVDSHNIEAMLGMLLWGRSNWNIVVSCSRGFSIVADLWYSYLQSM